MIILLSIVFISYSLSAYSTQAELQCELVKVDDIPVNKSRTKRSAPSTPTDFWEDGNEYQHFDRDNYINIDKNEIRKYFESKNIDINFDTFFDKLGKESARVGEYDYNSIMHYVSFHLSRVNGPPTITRKDEINEGIIPKSQELSSRDKIGLQYAYSERCTNLRPQEFDELNSLKTTLCQIAKEMHSQNTFFVNAYSNLMKYNILFFSSRVHTKF